MEIVKTLSETLDQWNKVIREQNRDKAVELKNELASLITETTDPTLKKTYDLYRIRFFLLLKDYQQVLKGFAAIGPSKDLPDDRAKFYYYFFNGILMYDNRRYQEAEENLSKAESYLSELDDREEIAEFKYKLASAYHRVSNFGLSLVEATEALEIFKKENNIKRSANCENLLAVNNKNMGQYKMAEKHYKNAKRNAEKLDDKQSQSTIYHNLGSLYASQDLPETAISYLKKAEQLMLSEQSDLITRTKYVLAKELFKTKKVDEACQQLKNGLHLSGEYGNEGYIHHFRMLEVKYSPENDNLVEIYNNGINFFKSKEMWDHVMEYSEELAIHYQEIDRHKEANAYYTLAIQARNTIEKKGAILL